VALQREVVLQVLQGLLELERSHHQSWTNHHLQGWWPAAWERREAHQRETGVLSGSRRGWAGQWREHLTGSPGMDQVLM
jgi:hypothetical protein